MAGPQGHAGSPSGAGGLAETHISWVFFAGDRAYKLLKPVRTPFLDYSTPERRREACEAEVRLNRRLSPDVYLGVSPIVEGGPEAPRVVDHLVVMRRLPADRRLSALVATDEGPAQVRRVARAVAAFHASLPPDPEAARVAAPEAVAHLWAQNLEEMRALPPGLLDPAELDEVARRAERYVTGRAPLLRSRIEAGLAVDGHGDLLADDIFCLDDGPRILDCLAFDPDLRRGDVLADLAFLAMDLERLGGPGAADALLGAYDEFTDEHHPRSLVDHWIAYRALVRAKVTCLRALQTEGPAHDAAATEARRFLDQCLSHLRAATVRLVLVGGAPGTGKTTVAAAVASELDAVLLASDEVRKDLAGVARSDHTGAGLDQGLYAPEVTEGTYRELLHRAVELLGSGRSVVLDATWADAGRRTAARRAGAGAAAELVELRCVLDPEVAAARVAARLAAGGDASDATPELARKLASRFDPWPEAADVDTSGTPADALSVALGAVGPHG